MKSLSQVKVVLEKKLTFSMLWHRDKIANY